MTNKHISRDHSAHKNHIKRPYDEYVKLEIFSNHPSYTKLYFVGNKQLKQGKNCVRTNWKSWSCYKSKNSNQMIFNLSYSTKKSGYYRIDMLYEQNDSIHDNDKIDTGKDLVGGLKVTSKNITEYDKDFKFDGENNVIKRRIAHTHLGKGIHNLTVEVPHNCYFYGVIIRRVLKYVGENYYSDSIDSEDNNLVLTSASITNSDMSKPTEMQCEIFYDPKLECEDSPSGFYIDYMDELNFYIKDNDNEVRRVFGGYVTSILPDSKLQKITIHGADRLNDGVNKYILDQMVLQGGTKDQKSDEYSDGMTKNFKNYAEALKYVCDVHEVTLKSNISKDYTVDGEKYHRGFSISYGTKKKVKKIPVSNGYSTAEKNYILLRNKSSAVKKQAWTLYDAKTHSKKPPEISKFPYLHIIYGLGDVERSYKTQIVDKVDVSETTAGSQKFGKCGVSQDGKYVMAIGTVSSAKDTGSYGTYYKGVFENKCPHCGEAKLVWDSCRSDTNCVHTQSWGGSKRSWGVASIETEITCNGCDSDFSAQGIEKDSPWKRLNRVSKIVQSSRAEQDKLHRGEMIAVPKTGATVSSDDVFKAITKTAFQYKYSLSEGSQTYNDMKRTGKGDCWGFSDLIFTELKRYGVNCKIVEYRTEYSDAHRSVLFVNNKNEWQDFPYREYNWNTKYNNMLNNTGGSKNGRVVNINKTGGNIGNCKVTGSTSKTQKTTVTHTTGYSTKTPFQAYLKITYSLEPKFSAKKYKVYVKFTQEVADPVSLNTGLNVYWINNKIKMATLNHDLIDFLRRTVHNNMDARIYLQSIHFVTPKKKAKRDNTTNKKTEDASWYKVDKQTDDQSSCKLNLYKIVFNDNASVDPSELNSCGKSANSMLQELVKQSGFLVNMEYGLHRKDDKINFSVNNNTKSSFTASEGDNNNILSWNSISYSPVGSMFNMSMQVFKLKNGQYKYIDTRSPSSILKYGEQCTLQTSNQAITENEAYYNAIMSDKYDPTQRYSYTITVPNYPYLNIGSLVQVRANAKKLNSVKEVKSIKIVFDKKKMPRIQTEIGLDELAPDIQLKKNIRKLRQNAKEQSTYFYKSATPVSDEIYYEWEGD